MVQFFSPKKADNFTRNEILCFPVGCNHVMPRHRFPDAREYQRRIGRRRPARNRAGVALVDEPVPFVLDDEQRRPQAGQKRARGRAAPAQAEELPDMQRAAVAFPGRDIPRCFAAARARLFLCPAQQAPQAGQAGRGVKAKMGQGPGEVSRYRKNEGSCLDQIE
ncbi:MAG: hypothetical protein LBV01_04570, partial [Deltaproteobacteria bacterium]|nr:hypothetical protein [Deltaproteobacteria bacterium]